jgi:FkbM family methyltransferase
MLFEIKNRGGSCVLRILSRLRKDAKRGIVPKGYIKRFLPSDPVIVEAGAHIGVDTVELAREWPKAKIYAFEPVPAVYDQLVSKTRDLANVTPLKLALGDKNGSSEIYVSGGQSDGSSSLLVPKEHLKVHPDDTFDDKISIEVITLDSWRKASGLQKIDFLWLDLQGLELAVLKCGPDTLKNVHVIYTEVSLIENYAEGALYPELRSWLEGNGFRVQLEAIAWKDGGNVLFVRE